ncbi:PREDICTED: uncharacterized protein LOC106128304 [Papilio xuthus]|uniref:Uncharacterized protein LOC106128304 n=1 Tax=Papilio xuthus TaxID=66420 RepID=A0AAJ6ZYK1_PAPXU|nr:PREDICTED: uncharacterized protein LOC106128304 [Papilio xuthus]
MLIQLQHNRIASHSQIHIYFYEEIRNQYKRSFIEFHHKICDFLTKDPYIGAVAANLGLDKCPVRNGIHRLLNVTTNYDNFLNVFPFTKGRIDFWFNCSDTGEGVTGATAFVAFKNEFKRKQGQRKY